MSLVGAAGLITKAVAVAYVSWRESGPFVIGSNTASGVAALAARRADTSGSQANGALIRVSIHARKRHAAFAWAIKQADRVVLVFVRDLAARI